MKAHKITLEMLGKRYGAVAGRLPTLYDHAVKVLEAKVDTSISAQAPFKMHVAQLSVSSGVQIEGTKTITMPAQKLVRVTDIETGYYVKLVQVENEDKTRTLEVGRILSVEEMVQGNLNTRAW